MFGKRKAYDPQAASASVTGRQLAAELRQTREGLGFELHEVASQLRLRPAYLEAIEAGRFEELPGTTYAIGFLRSYAEYLGLDPEQIVSRFKEEVAGLPRRSELYLPTPVPEGRLPGGTVLLGTVVLASIVYGGWYYLSATDRDVADLVPTLPDRLVSLLDNLPFSSTTHPMSEAEIAETIARARETVAQQQAAPPAAAVPAPATAQVAAQVPAPATTPAPAPVQTASAPAASTNAGGASSTLAAPPASTVPAPVAEVAKPVAAPEAAKPPVPVAPPVAAAPAAPAVVAATVAAPVTSQPPAAAPAPAPTPAPAPAQLPAPAQTATAPVAPPAAPPASSSRPAEKVEAMVPPEEEETEGIAQEPTPLSPQVATLAPPPPPAVDPAPEPVGKVYGSQNANVRLQLRATQDSWVQVRDGEGQIVFTRVLKPGDVYRVADRPGMRVRTGNAGGLIIVTDGVEGQPLGAVGQVLRDVALDNHLPAIRNNNAD